MTPYLELIEQDLVDAARRRGDAQRRPVARRSARSLLLAAALALLVGGSAMAGTLYVLRGSPIPAPEERDAGASQTVEPGTSRVLPMRAADPAGGPPFALRVASSRTGLVCSTVGQVEGDAFGLVGLDGAFRPFEDGVVDSCGQRRPNAASLVGARVLDARRERDVRTVVSGVAGEGLREAVVQAGGQERLLTPGPDGTFVTVERGYPEDLGVRVVLRFADGHTEEHPFGTSDFVVTDPAGGPAWQTTSFGFGRGDVRCVSFRPARDRLDGAISPAACGRLAGKPNHERGYFFAVRKVRETRSRTRRFDEVRGRWRGAPRTAVWGLTGKDVQRIVIVGPNGDRRSVARAPSAAFLAVYGPDVDPHELRVELTLANGTTRTLQGDTNLASPTRTRPPVGP